MSANAEISELAKFFGDYSAYEQNLNRLHVQQTKNKLAVFFTEFNSFYQAAQERERSNASSYNIFSILDITRYEAWFHTPMLGNLFSITGSHFQGDIFVLPLIKLAFRDINTEDISNIITHTEYHTINGNLDLFITFFYKKERHFIVIENKIDAEDQPDQLLRYYKYIQSQHISDSNARLIYLTKSGTPPSTGSIAPDLYDVLKKKETVLQWSHNKDMVKILSSSIPLIKAPNVKQTVLQYIQTIKDL